MVIDDIVNFCKYEGIKILSITLGGSYISGLKKETSDCDLFCIGIFENNELIHIRRRLSYQNYDIIIFDVRDVFDKHRNGSYYYYLYMDNDNLIYCKYQYIRNRILNIDKMEVCKYLIEETNKEFDLFLIQPKSNKQFTHLVYEVGCVSLLLGGIKSYSFANILRYGCSNLLFKLLVLKLLNRIEYPPTNLDLNILKDSLFYNKLS